MQAYVVDMTWILSLTLQNDKGRINMKSKTESSWIFIERKKSVPKTNLTDNSNLGSEQDGMKLMMTWMVGVLCTADGVAGGEQWQLAIPSPVLFHRMGGGMDDYGMGMGGAFGGGMRGGRGGYGGRGGMGNMRGGMGGLGGGLGGGFGGMGDGGMGDSMGGMGRGSFGRGGMRWVVEVVWREWGQGVGSQAHVTGSFPNAGYLSVACCKQV